MDTFNIFSCYSCFVANVRYLQPYRMKKVIYVRFHLINFSVLYIQPLLYYIIIETFNVQYIENHYHATSNLTKLQ